MAALPQPGTAAGRWGDILNDYLLEEHTAEGTHNVVKMLGIPHTAGKTLVSAPATVLGYRWEEASLSLPTGGTTGQFLRKSATGDGNVNWADITKQTVGLDMVTNDVQLRAADLATDPLLGADSDSKIPSQKAVKSYVDTKVSAIPAAEVIASGTTAQYWRGDKTWHTLDKAAVGLGSVTDDAQLKAADLDVDATLVANSDGKVPSQKAVKSYVDTRFGSIDTSAYIAKAGDTMVGLLTAGNGLNVTGMTTVTSTLQPATSNNVNFGSSSAYWNNAYVKRLNLNGTSYIDGATSGLMTLSGKVNVSSSLTMPGSGDTNALGVTATATNAFTSGALYGMNLQARASAGTSAESVGWVVGGKFNAYVSSTCAAPVNTLRGGWFVAEHVGTGNVSGATAGIFTIYRSTNTGTMTSAQGLYVTAVQGTGTGAIQNLYGLYIEGQTAGATLNYAIYTNSGQVRFGDNTILAGGVTLKRTAVSDAAYTATATDHIIAYTSLTAARTVTLPSTAVAGKVYVIKDETGTAATRNITVAPASGTIDGAASKVINTNFGSLKVYSNGTNWFIIA